MGSYECNLFYSKILLIKQILAINLTSGLESVSSDPIRSVRMCCAPREIVFVLVKAACIHSHGSTVEITLRVSTDGR